MFEVGYIPLTCTGAPRNYRKDSINTFMTHMLVSEMYINFFRRVLQLEDNFAKVNYSGLADSNRNQPLWISQTNKIAQIHHQ